jgi:DNA-binding NarL/FixJ family response regulator
MIAFYHRYRTPLRRLRLWCVCLTYLVSLHSTNALIAKSCGSRQITGTWGYAHWARYGALRVKTFDPADNETEHDRRLQDHTFQARNRCWIVLVDDEESIRASVGQFLFDQGYQVTACADADAVLQVCAEPQRPGQLPRLPDAIVSDVRMPGKDGIELLGIIRNSQRLERVPVILLTAKAMTQDRVLGYRAGADVYLPKPFNPDELLSILDNTIQRKQQMTGTNGSLLDLKEEMSNIKELMKQNGKNVVKKTTVYLTPTERKVLGYLSQGYTNAEIADARGVNVQGVIRMIQKMYSETGTRNRTELVRWAMQTGYVSQTR